MTSTDATQERAIAAAVDAWGWDPTGVAVHPLGNPFFRDWTFCRVHDEDVVPPTVAFLALHARAVDLLDPEDGFNALVALEPVRLATEKEAVDYVRLLLSVTEHMTEVALPSSDITWATDEARLEWAERIQAPTAERQGPGWQVRVWLVAAGDLLRARFAIDERGSVTVERDVAQPHAAIHVPLL